MLVPSPSTPSYTLPASKNQQVSPFFPKLTLCISAPTTTVCWKSSSSVSPTVGCSEQSCWHLYFLLFIYSSSSFKPATLDTGNKDPLSGLFDLGCPNLSLPHLSGKNPPDQGQASTQTPCSSYRPQVQTDNLRARFQAQSEPGSRAFLRSRVSVPLAGGAKGHLPLK